MTQSVDFTSNLQLLCSYHKSIAEVCRRLKFNRAQFNRYLNGSNKPRANAMLRICDFFGVEEFELMMPHSQFRQLIKMRPVRKLEQQDQREDITHLNTLNSMSNNGMDKYQGYYFEYHYSMIHSGKILRNLISFEKRGDKVFYQRIERPTDAITKKSHLDHGIYLGVAHFLADRIFMNDYESLTVNEMTQTVLFPTFKNKITQLKGLKIGVSAGGDRMPICTRVVFEYLGRSVNLKKALLLCGFYPNDSEDIEDNIKVAITNDIADDEWHFKARY